MRRRTYHVLTGSLLGVWTHLEGVFTRYPTQNHKIQIVRVHCDNKKLVGKHSKVYEPLFTFFMLFFIYYFDIIILCYLGILIPLPCVKDIKLTLGRIAQQAAGTANDCVEVIDLT